MALITCKNCGNLVSDQAMNCPKCGTLISSGDATRLNTPNQPGHAPQYGSMPPQGDTMPPQGAPVFSRENQMPPQGHPMSPQVNNIPVKPNRKMSPVLIAVLAAIGTAVLLIGGFALYKYVIEPKTGNDEPELVRQDGSSSTVDDSPRGRDSYRSDNQPAEEDFAWLSQRYVTLSDIAGKTSAELRIMRNSIYARHGRYFKDPALREYFKAQSWYDPYRDEVPNEELNGYEKKNVEFLKSHE